MKPASRRPRPALPPRARTWARRALAAWLGWLLLSTLLLNQPLMDGWINRKPERAHVGWRFAVSLVPGHLHAWGVHVRGHSRRNAWAIHAGQASAWWLPWALLDRDVHLARLRASDVAVHVKRGRASRAHPGVQAPAAAAPPAAAWTVTLSDLQAEDIWSVVLDGSARITGRAAVSLDLRKVLSGGGFRLDQGRVDWRSLEVAVGTMRPVRGGHVSGSFALQPVAPAGTTAARWLAAASADLAFDLDLPALALDGAGLRTGAAAQAPGTLAGRLRLDHGRVGDDTAIRLSQPLHVADGGPADDRRFEASASIRGDRVDVAASLPPAAGDDTVFNLALSLPRKAVVRIGAGIKAGDGSTGAAAADTLLGANGSVDVRLRFQSLSLLGPWLARWHGVEASGQGWMLARLRLADGRLLPESRLSFQHAALRIAALGHRLDARVDGDLQRVEGPVPHRRLALQSVQLRGPDDELLLSDAGARLEFLQPDPAAHLLDPPTVSLEVRDAAIPDLRVFNRYLPPGTVAFGDGRATLGLGLTVQPDAGRAHGHLQLASPAARVQLADMRLDGAVSVSATLEDADLVGRDVRVQDLKLDLAKVHFDQHQGPSVADWWLRAHVPAARARVALPLQLSGQARFAMADLRLLLALYARRGDYPAWLLRLADAGQVDGGGRFELADGVVALRQVRVRNQRYTVDATLRLREGRKDGRLLAQWGRLAVGIGLSGGRPELHVLKAREWYRSGGP